MPNISQDILDKLKKARDRCIDPDEEKDFDVCVQELLDTLEEFFSKNFGFANNSKYCLGNGETIVVHTNVGVNTYKDGEWTGFYECSQEEDFENVMSKLKPTRLNNEPL